MSARFWIAQSFNGISYGALIFQDLALLIWGGNGMGETTLARSRSIVGFTPPREGRVRY